MQNASLLNKELLTLMSKNFQTKGKNDRSMSNGDQSDQKDESTMKVEVLAVEEHGTSKDLEKDSEEYEITRMLLGRLDLPNDVQASLTSEYGNREYMTEVRRPAINWLLGVKEKVKDYQDRLKKGKPGYTPETSPEGYWKAAFMNMTDYFEDITQKIIKWEITLARHTEEFLEKQLANVTDLKSLKVSEKSTSTDLEKERKFNELPLGSYAKVAMQTPTLHPVVRMKIAKVVESGVVSQEAIRLLSTRLVPPKPRASYQIRRERAGLPAKENVELCSFYVMNYPFMPYKDVRNDFAIYGIEKAKIVCQWWISKKYLEITCPASEKESLKSQMAALGFELKDSLERPRLTDEERRLLHEKIVERFARVEERYVTFDGFWADQVCIYFRAKRRELERALSNDSKNDNMEIVVPTPFTDGSEAMMQFSDGSFSTGEESEI
jgi:hypothetical protein